MGMQRADALTVVHHDDTTSVFLNVTYTLDRDELRVVTARGDVRTFPMHDVLTTHVRLTHQRRPSYVGRMPTDSWPVGA
jgi:hypothetical protein